MPCYLIHILLRKDMGSVLDIRQNVKIDHGSQLTDYPENLSSDQNQNLYQAGGHNKTTADRILTMGRCPTPRILICAAKYVSSKGRPVIDSLSVCFRSDR